MKRSRSGQSGSFGLWRMTFAYSRYAVGAMPIGSPGWPLLAFWTASIDSVRIVSTLSWSIDVEEVAADMHHNLPTHICRYGVNCLVGPPASRAGSDCDARSS